MKYCRPRLAVNDETRLQVGEREEGGVYFSEAGGV